MTGCNSCCTCTPHNPPLSLAERTKCSTGKDVLVTKFIKIDLHNPFHNQIKNHFLNVTPAFFKGQAVTSFIPEYVKSFHISVSRMSWIWSESIPRLCLDVQDGDYIQFWNYKNTSHWSAQGQVCQIYNAVINEYTNDIQTLLKVTETILC